VQAASVRASAARSAPRATIGASYEPPARPMVAFGF
jgi:hypothetical protein